MDVIYKFQDGEFVFYTAEYGSHLNDARVVFRVGVDRIPEDRAKEKGITGWDRLVPTPPYERSIWLLQHPDYPLVELPELEQRVMIGMEWFDHEIRREYEIQFRKLLMSGAVDFEKTSIYMVCKVAIHNTVDNMCRVLQSFKREFENLRKI